MMDTGCGKRHRHISFAGQKRVAEEAFAHHEDHPVDSGTQAEAQRASVAFYGLPGLSLLMVDEFAASANPKGHDVLISADFNAGPFRNAYLIFSKTAVHPDQFLFSASCSKLSRLLYTFSPKFAFVSIRPVLFCKKLSVGAPPTSSSAARGRPHPQTRARAPPTPQRNPPEIPGGICCSKCVSVISNFLSVW